MSPPEVLQDTATGSIILEELGSVFLHDDDSTEVGSFALYVSQDRSLARKGVFIYGCQPFKNDDVEPEIKNAQSDHESLQSDYEVFLSEHEDAHSDNDGGYVDNLPVVDQEYNIQNLCMDADEDFDKIDWMRGTPGQPRRYANTEAERAAAHRQWKAYHVEQAAALKVAKREAAIICENKAKLRKLTPRQQRRLDNERFIHGGKRPPSNYIEPQLSSDESSETEEPAITVPQSSVQKFAQLSERISSSDKLSFQAQNRAKEIERQIAALSAEKEALFTEAGPNSSASFLSLGQDVSSDSMVLRRSQNRRKRIIADGDDDDLPSVKKTKRNSSTFNSSPTLPHAHKSTPSKISDGEVDEDFKPTVKKATNGNNSSRKSPSKVKYENESNSKMTDDESIRKLPKVAKPVARKTIPPTSGRPATWTDAEHNALELEIRVLRKEEASSKTIKPLRDMGLFSHVSVLLSRNHQVIRNGGACKNYWNRYGRARAGFDERRKVEGAKRDLVTSFQGPKKR